MSSEKVVPDPEDFAALDREMGPLPPNATYEEQAVRYRLAQVEKVIRLNEANISRLENNAQRLLTLADKIGRA